MNQSLKLNIIIEDNPTLLAMTAANIFLSTAAESVSKTGLFMLAVSGGSTPREMHRLLAEEPYRSDIPWNDTHIFWVDERCVPVDDPASNYGLAKKDFLDRAPIPPDQIHPMPGEAAPEEGAVIYSGDLQKSFQIKESDFPVFDLIFLGVGKDGHTASLFPGQRALDEKQRWVVNVKGGHPDVSRLTMSYPVLNHAGHIVFLASGKEKAMILKEIIENRSARLPAQKVQPVNGTLTWLLDRDGASLLSGELTREIS